MVDRQEGPRTMHERISFNNMNFVGTTLAQDIASWQELQARRIGVFVPKLEAAGWTDGVAMLVETGLAVATFTHPFLLGGTLDQRHLREEARDRLFRTIDAAKALGGETVYLVTGGRGALDWEEAADAFAEAVAPCAAAAKECGIPLLIETANALYSDVHFAHTLADTTRLATLSGVGVCLDIFACWTEASLQQRITEALPLIGLVQVSDHVAGDRSLPCRAVPGDGSIPLTRILKQVLDEGYSGAFDLELVGPRIVAEGPVIASRRAGAWLGNFLTDYQAGTGK